MLDLETGTILLEKSNVVLSRTLSVDKFKNDFPASQIHDTQDMGNGYLWSRFFDEIFKDEPCLFSLCFEPSKYLSQIFLFPGKNEFSDWNDWSEAQMKKDKEYFDKWLFKVFDLFELHKPRKSWLQTIFDTRKPYKGYDWGKIASYLDQRSGDSGIVINYNNF